jgi:hypothetical protein
MGKPELGWNGLYSSAEADIGSGDGMSDGAGSATIQVVSTAAPLPHPG